MAKQNAVKSRRKIVDYDDPVFHLQTKQEEDKQLTPGMIKVVRKTGELNLSGRNMVNVPGKIFKMYEVLSTDQINFDFNRSGEEDDWWNFKPLTFLDLSSNVIQEIPEQIGMFEDITKLNLQDNSLTSLPSSIGKLKKLTRLNASRNKINSLPDEFYKLSELQVLSLAYNNLEKLSNNFVDLVMLQHLDLSNNCLTQLPSGIGFLVRIIEINLSHNKLTELPPDIVNLRALLKLDVTHNNLKSLPRLGELRKLQCLYAQHNDIEDLPDFEGCESIKELYFGNNFIKDVTKEFCEDMLPLKILDLRDNQIKKLPDEIAMLQHVIRLDLTNNELETLPNSLCLLPRLQNLQIEGNKLKQIRTDVIKGGTLRILKHLRDKLNEVELENIAKTSKPVLVEKKIYPDKYVMRNCRALNLTMKELSIVPDEVFEDAKFAEVTIVDLSKNKLTEIPEGLKTITDTVGELNLSMNQIQEVPEFMGSCFRLKYLELSNNLLSSLPDSLGALPYLRELVLSGNRFTCIPDCVYNMVGLEILLVCDNKVEKIDVDGLKKLTRLAVLDLTNNNISQIPPELGNVKQLRSLELKGNPFRQPRYAVLEQGTEVILSYLRDRIAA